jgi:hypothetical protein
MKKNIYILIGLMVFVLAGCGKKDQMVNFIPTPTPAADNEKVEVTEDSAAGNGEDTPGDTNEDGSADTPVVEGNTTAKYVKLSEYGAVLNVRSEPSTDGKVVGSLVHAEKVEVVKIEDGWACFVLKDKYAYVKADFLVDEKPAFLEPPTPTPTPVPTLPPTNTPTPETETTP